MKKNIFIIAAVLIVMVFVSSCGKSGSTSSQENPVSSSQEEPQEQTASVFIGFGSESSDYKEYQFSYEGELTPDILIEEIASITGWNLDLEKPVEINDDGSFSVCFADTASIFTGPPEEQKEEFFVYDVQQLCETIFDSVKYTIAFNFGENGMADIYYSAKDGEPIVIEQLGITIPADKPYEGIEAENGQNGESSETTGGNTSVVECQFQGLADGHSVEVYVNGGIEVYQFSSPEVENFLEGLDIDQTFKCEISTDNSTQTKTILKIIE